MRLSEGVESKGRHKAFERLGKSKIVFSFQSRK